MKIHAKIGGAKIRGITKRGNRLKEVKSKIKIVNLIFFLKIQK